MIPAVYTDPDFMSEPVKEEPKPEPQLCPECWQTVPVDSERAWNAVIAMCRGQ